MVHISTLAITTKTDHGVFYCPQCADQRLYQRKIKRRFLTLYFIPVFPLDIASDTVYCQACKNPYEAQVLQANPRVHRNAAEVHLRRLILLMLLAGGPLTPEDLQEARRIHAKLSAESWTDAELAEDLGLLRTTQATAAAYARRVVLSLGEPAKDSIVMGAFLAASARGELSSQQLHELTQLPDALQVADIRYRKLVERALTL